MITVAATALAWWISGQVSYTDLDWLSYDLTVLHGGLRPPSNDIVNIDIDEETFDRVGRYPFPRGIIADIVRRVGNAHPKTIGLDVLLSEPRNEAEDKQLQDALTSAGSVVLVSLAPIGGRRALMPQPIFCEPDPANAHEISGFCKDGAPGAFGYAFVNLPFDADGFIRQAILVHADEGTAKPPSGLPVSFAVTMAQNFTDTAISLKKKNAVFGGREVHYWDRQDGTFLIGSWAREPAVAIPAWKLLEGRVPDSALAGKMVLIGQSNSAANDRQFTPLFRSPDRRTGERPRLPGTQVLAAAIRSLLEGTTVRRTPGPVVWGVAALVCFTASFLLFRLNTGVGLLCALALGILGAAVSLVLYARTHTWLPFLPEEVGLVLTVPFTLALQFLLERIVSREANAQRKQMMSLFASYVDPAVADTIWQRRSEVSLAGEERVATVMFTDIRSFTALSFGKPPAQVLAWLNEYLSAMDEVIREYGGFLNKFIGDGLMIIFGLPLSKGAGDDAQRAMRAAQAMLRRVEVLNEKAVNDTSRPCLRIGIGVHSGPLMAGSIGSAARQEYSVIGETVNLASRLESQNKTFKTEILFSESTRTLLGGSFPGVVALGDANVPGLQQPVPVYTLQPLSGGSKQPEEKNT